MIAMRITVNSSSRNLIMETILLIATMTINRMCLMRRINQMIKGVIGMGRQR